VLASSIDGHPKSVSLPVKPLVACPLSGRFNLRGSKQMHVDQADSRAKKMLRFDKCQHFLVTCNARHRQPDKSTKDGAARLKISKRYFSGDEWMHQHLSAVQ
jgi:hypothetical protein